jgi:thiol-disulfide isomerase/thioredoxin
MNCISLAAVTFALFAPERTTPNLKIGDPAPPLAVSRWLKGEPVKRFDTGKTYVVEFWATWCGPCVGCMPYLTELHKIYKDRVTFISVDVAERDQAKVTSFVQEMGDNMGYAVAADDVPAGDERGLNGRMWLNWVAAAGERGIPCAFIISQGKVAWIDHPIDMCAALDKILAGGWDFAEAERVHRQRSQASRRYQEVVQPALDGTHKDGPPNAETLAQFDKAVAADPELELGQLSQWKFVHLLIAGRVDDAIRYGEKLVDSAYADRPTKLTMIAAFLTEDTPKRPGSKPGYSLALKAATRASELCHHVEPNALDVLARAYSKTGQAVKALETELRAFKFAANPDDEMKQRLEQYRKAASSKAP